MNERRPNKHRALYLTLVYLIRMLRFQINLLHLLFAQTVALVRMIIITIIIIICAQARRLARARARHLAVAIH